MPEYRKHEARDWARAHMRGVANTITPTFTHDLRGLNEAAIRHDVRKEIEFGFWGALLVAETATTLEEYVRFTEWAADEAAGRLRLIHHASFNTLEENVHAAQAAEQAGADLVLLSYPPTFYPDSADDIYAYTKAFCDGTNLAVMLFPVPLWGFERIHPAAGFGPDLIARLLDDVPNIAAIKAEGGMPSIGGFVDVYRRFGERVVVTEPIEANGLPMACLVPMQFMGTSNYEYWGPTIPEIFGLIRSDSGRAVRGRDAALLADSARPPSEYAGHGDAGRREFSAPHGVEVPRLAGRFQRRPAPHAHHASDRPPDEAVASGFDRLGSRSAGRRRQSLLHGTPPRLGGRRDPAAHQP